MAIKAILDSLDGVDESIKGFYVEHDGKFRLDVEGGFKTTSEVEGLSSALGKEREANKANAKLLKAFEGIDAEAARDALAKVSNWDENQQKAAEKMQKEFEARLAPLTAERDKYKLESEQYRTKLDAFTIDAALRSSKAFEKVEDPIYREHLQQLVRSNLKIQDGSLVGVRVDGVQVFDSNGNPAQGDALIDGIIKSIPNYERFFAGSKSNGTGANPGAATYRAGNTGKMSAEEAGKLSPEEYAKARREGRI